MKAATRPRQVLLGGREIDLALTTAATNALARGGSPVIAEMELYFSCLIRKQVRFPAVTHADAQCIAVDDCLTVCFRPVMTRACSMDAVGDKPELEAFPIHRPGAFLPKWLRLDFRQGAWLGEFGY